MSLPQGLNLSQLSNTWASQLDPLLVKPIVNGLLLQDVALIVGTTAVNHLLGRKLRGWIVVGINGIASIYDNQATNQTPQLTLSLTSDAAITCSLWVF